ncbi:MAG: formate--tetrahydrofolate ligase, partial [Candidatus Omnitrophota bacterium]
MMGQTEKRKRKVKSLHVRPISEVARSVGIRKKYLESYGEHTAKLSLDLLRIIKNKKRGKYVIVTSVTPTPFGEGKTITAIGLSMALGRLKKRSIPCVTQSPISNIFGTRGVGLGAGMCQLFPVEDANLHLTGDTHAIQSAHNLCAAYLDNSIFNGNPLDINPDHVLWKRVLDVEDRALRYINTGLGSKTDGISRKTGFEFITASELAAIVALAENMKDLRERIGRIIVAITRKEKPVTCEDIKAAGAMTVLLKNAIKPNLLQTTEGTPCLVHALSSGDVGLGVTSVIADRIALGLSEYAIVETGFGAELGAEKFFDIKCRTSDIKPDLAVIVCSVRALKMHSNDFEISADKQLPRELLRENISAIERGLSNLEKQIENVKTFGIPVVICINRFNNDTDKEISAIEKRVKD